MTSKSDAFSWCFQAVEAKSSFFSWRSYSKHNWKHMGYQFDSLFVAFGCCLQLQTKSPRPMGVLLCRSGSWHNKFTKRLFQNGGRFIGFICVHRVCVKPVSLSPQHTFFILSFYLFLFVFISWFGFDDLMGSWTQKSCKKKKSWFGCLDSVIMASPIYLEWWKMMAWKTRWSTLPTFICMGFHVFLAYPLRMAWNLILW